MICLAQSLIRNLRKHGSFLCSAQSHGVGMLRMVFQNYCSIHISPLSGSVKELRQTEAVDVLRTGGRNVFQRLCCQPWATVHLLK